MIREITDDENLSESLEIIRNSFMTVAEEFGLTKENCPTNPAFIGTEKLNEMRESDQGMFGLFHDNKQVGFVAIEKLDDDVYYMMKLAVLPEYRHRGFGRKLMDFVSDYVKGQNGKTLSIVVIDENRKLKAWYSNCGFVETNVKKFEHLPFTVCHMEKKLI